MVFAREMTKALGFTSGLVLEGSYHFIKDIDQYKDGYNLDPLETKIEPHTFYYNSFSPLDFLLKSNMEGHPPMSNIEKIATLGLVKRPHYFPIGSMKLGHMYRNEMRKLYYGDNGYGGWSGELRWRRIGKLRVELAKGGYLYFDPFAMGFVDRKLANSSEFLMTPFDYDIVKNNIPGLPTIKGKSLLGLMKGSFLFGPKTLDVLAMMGYRTRTSPLMKSHSPPLKYSTFYEDNNIF